MFLTDSLICLGALAEGRSASPALNSELLKLLPYLLGSDFSPGFDFVPTRLNPGDSPSRGVRLLSTPSPDPPWLHHARTGDLALLDKRRRVGRQSRATVGWAALVWHFLEFDSTLGYPGEGPGRILRDS